MRKIIISAGHGGSDPGAAGNGFVERDLAIELRLLIVNELKTKYGIDALIDSPQNALAQTLAWLRGKFSSKDILLDLHWNSGGGTGIEVIIPDVSSSFERNIAQVFADRISDITGLKKRSGGVKPEGATARKRLGWMRPNAENVLIEMCFIDSRIDIAAYQNNKINISKAIAKVLFEFSKI